MAQGQGVCRQGDRSDLKTSLCDLLHFFLTVLKKEARQVNIIFCLQSLYCLPPPRLSLLLEVKQQIKKSERSTFSDILRYDLLMRSRVTSNMLLENTSWV